MNNSINNNTVITPPPQQGTYDLIDFWFAMSCLAAVLGTFGNLFFGILIRKQPSLWKYVNYKILLCIIIADFFTNVFCIPFESAQTFMWLKYRQFLGNDDFCMFEAGIFIQALSLSNLGQTLLAIYKFLAVFFPIFYRQKMSSSRTLAILYCVFVVMPVMLFYYGGLSWLIWYNMDPSVGDCREISMVPAVDLFRNIFFQYLPIIISLLIYFMILGRILSLMVGGSSGKNSDQRKQVLKSARGSMAMCTSMIVYAVCVSLYWFEYASDSYGKAIGSNIWKKYAMRLTFSINPVFYATLDGNLRKVIIAKIKSKIGGGGGSKTEATSNI